jgi:hypothetical protein
MKYAMFTCMCRCEWRAVLMPEMLTTIGCPCGRTHLITDGFEDIPDTSIYDWEEYR